MPYYPDAGGILPNSVSDVYLADMPAGTVKGRAVGSGTGDPQNLTQAQLAAIVAASVPAYSYRNILGRNGGFEVWQRGAGGSALFNFAANSAGYTADGWFLSLSPGQASQIAQVAGLTNGSRYAARFVRSAGQTGVTVISLEFALDTDEVALLRGNIVTLSMMMQAGPTWSPAGGALSVAFQTGTGANAARISSGLTSPVNIIPSTPQAITTTPTRYSFTSSVVVPANATQGCVLLQWTPVGTAGPNDMFDMDDVQLEVGSIATPFERRFFESELLACQRHFWKSFEYAVAPVTGSGTNGAALFTAATAAGGSLYWSIPFPIVMRATPICTVYNTSAANPQIRNINANTDCSSTAVSPTSRNALLNALSAPSTVVGHLMGAHLTADAGI